ncbi:DNA-binding protein [Bremerella cremea]|uniref:DNA-binding protein n=1 Tax=Bremerella cremea TaxID=1031537 RepID=A0A368KVW4_9BACT|nr:excisionase family DNA-binding protein [Bremerella cremea]RCS54570.1 DNA-binding protein [Bremerella cremea]
MASQIPSHFEMVTPNQADAELARESSRSLAACKLPPGTGIRLRLGDDDDGESIVVPASAFRLFQNLLTEMSQGNAVTLVPTQAELTTQQAADILNVSRPYLVKLLDEGKIPSRLVGQYRRVRLDDLMVYKSRDDKARNDVLDQLSADAQDQGMGY